MKQNILKIICVFLSIICFVLVGVCGFLLVRRKEERPLKVLDAISDQIINEDLKPYTKRYGVGTNHITRKVEVEIYKSNPDLEEMVALLEENYGDYVEINIVNDEDLWGINDIRKTEHDISDESFRAIKRFAEGK
ncbi:MAG: hypothetical protein IJP27_02550 [Clostridia bacterium]|nr:hypothetical protein [Clostridia bacterium]